MANVTPPTNGQERRAASRGGGGPGAPPPRRRSIRGCSSARSSRSAAAISRVRLPDEWTGLGGKIADEFNEVIDLNQRMARELDRLSRVVGKQGKIAERGITRRRGRVLGRGHRLRQHPDRRPRLSPERDVARHRRRGQGRPLPDHGPRDGRPRPGRRVPQDRAHRQHDGRAARLLRLRGHARGARGGHGRQARRPGQGQGRGRHLEGPHRLRQLHGLQPHRPGAQHRRRHHRRGRRRPLEEDHRRRQGRDPGAQGHHQHDGGPAPLVRFRSHARRPRGRHGGQARRPGRGARAWPAPGRTSPTPSTPWPASSPSRSATSRTSPRPSPPATSPARSPSTSRARSSS